MKNTTERLSKPAPPSFDTGGSGNSVILAGMGRSGTTWAGDIINYDHSYRVLFEPFFPKMTSEAKGFEYIQYLKPNDNNPDLIRQAKRILQGKVKNDWIDRDNHQLRYHHRIIKDIRINLMLGWLKKTADNPAIVLMVRHPLQVTRSWARLGWGKETAGVRSDLDIILSQKSLLNDFPVIGDTLKQIDQQNFLDRTIFQWCIYHTVPSTQLGSDDVYQLHYENLLTNFDHETSALFHYLDRPLDSERLNKTRAQSSSTNFLERDLSKHTQLLLNSWNSDFSTKQVKRAHYILSAFGLDEVYNEKGHPTGKQLCQSRPKLPPNSVPTSSQAIDYK